MKAYYISILCLVIFAFTFCQNDIFQTENDQINSTLVSGTVECNELPVSNAELSFTTEADTFVTITDADGIFEIELESPQLYNVIVYSLKYMEVYFYLESSTDTNITVNLEPIDYYPSDPGMTWKYSYEEKDDDANMWSYYVTIERIILSSSDSTITNQIHIEGWGYDLRINPTRDTIKVNQDFELIETINANGFYNSFLDAIPFEIGKKFKTMGKYLHPDPKSIQTNPSTLVPCELVGNSGLYSNVLKSENGIINFDQVPYWDISTTYIADNVGYTSIFHLYRHDFADRYYQLELLEFNKD